MHTVVNSLFNSCTYLVHRAGASQCVIVDCGDTLPIVSYLKQKNLSIAAILLTHAHFDHIYGLNELLGMYPEASVHTNEFGAEMLLNPKKNLSYFHESPFEFLYPHNIRIVNDGEQYECAENIMVKTVFTPGHNPSCITWIIDDMVFTGDSYIPGVKTVTNLPGGNKVHAMQSEELIMKLVYGKCILPGHHVDGYACTNN